MHVEYDSETDNAFVFLVPEEQLVSGLVAHELWPEGCNERVGLLFDERKRLVAIEVLGASGVLDEQILKGARPTGGAV